MAYDKIRLDAVTRLRPLLEAHDLKGIGDFTLNFTGSYRDLIASQMRDAYEFGKKGAADELKVAAPATKRDSLAFIAQSAQSITDKQMAELTFIVRAAILKRVRKNQLDDTIDEEGNYVTDAIDEVTAEAKMLFDNKVSLTGAVAVAQALNRGRMDAYQANRASIYAFQWSAVLDQRTCPICQGLDGSVVDYGTYNNSDWEPPIHIRCRCLIVAILADELNPPDITGYPTDPGGMLEPDL